MNERKPCQQLANYTLVFSSVGMQVWQNGEYYFPEELAPQCLAPLYNDLAARREAALRNRENLENWKERMEDRLDELESKIDDVELYDEDPYYEEWITEEREILVEDLESERDETEDKITDLEEKLEQSGEMIALLEKEMQKLRMLAMMQQQRPQQQ